MRIKTVNVGDIVIFTGLPSGGIIHHPAIVTRVINNDIVDLTVIYNRNSPTSIDKIKHFSIANNDQYWSYPKKYNILSRIFSIIKNYNLKLVPITDELKIVNQTLLDEQNRLREFNEIVDHLNK